MKVNNRGFTLLEVLVALFILSLAFSGYMVSMTNIARNDIYIKEKTVAMVIASNILSQLRIGLINEKTTDTGNHQIEMVNKKWYWNVERKTTADKNVTEVIIIVQNAKMETVYQLKGYLSNYV